MKELTVFLITPVAKPRMTQRDRWANRAPVLRWYAYKDELNLQANERKFVLPNTFKVTFYIPPSVSWSEKKKSELEGKLHRMKPDIDNLLKGVLDALRMSDATVADVHAIKKWSIQPRIEFEIKPADRLAV